MLKKISAILSIFATLSISAIQAVETVLYVLYDGTRAGEKNQVQGVASALKESRLNNLIQKEFDLKKNEQEFLADITQNIKEKPETKFIVLAAEVDSIQPLKNLKDKVAQINPHPLVIVSHSSHQYTQNHAQLKDVADIVALPESVVTEEIRQALTSPNTTLISLRGVPHNISLPSVEKAYQAHKDLIPAAKKYMGIILGGDAETAEHKLLYYTPEEAVQIASYIVLQVKNKAHLLILNGPRTGKHDPSTGKVIQTSHRDGGVDQVTAAFVQELQNRGLTQGQDFTLFDFQFPKPGEEKPSVYPVVLGALSATNSSIYVAGESTSMVSETADCLPGRVTVFKHGAMNPTHEAHCQSEYQKGTIQILEPGQGGKWQLLKAKAVTDTQAQKPASQILAEAIQKRLEEKEKALLG